MSFDENSDFAVIGEADVVNGGFTLNMSKDIPSDLLSPISKSNNLKYMTDLFISDETAKLGEIRIWGFLGDKKKGYFSCSTELGNMIYIYTDRKVTLRGKVAIPPQLGYNEIKYDMDLWAGFERYERYLNKHYTEDKSAVVIENLCFSTSIQYYTSTTWSFKRTY